MSNVCQSIRVTRFSTCISLSVPREALMCPKCCSIHDRSHAAKVRKLKQGGSKNFRCEQPWTDKFRDSREQAKRKAYHNIWSFLNSRENEGEVEEDRSHDANSFRRQTKVQKVTHPIVTNNCDEISPTAAPPVVAPPTAPPAAAPTISQPPQDHQIDPMLELHLETA